MAPKIEKKLKNAKKRAETRTIDLADFLDKKQIKEEKVFTIEGVDGEKKTIRIGADELKLKIEREVEIDERVIRSGPPYHFTVRNVNFDMSLEKLLEFFDFAEVTESSIKKNMIGHSRTGEYLLMVNSIEELKACLARDGQFFAGRDLSIEIYKDKYQRKMEFVSTYMSRYKSYDDDGINDNWDLEKKNRDVDYSARTNFGYENKANNYRQNFSTNVDWNEQKKNSKQEFVETPSMSTRNTKTFSEAENVSDWNKVKQEQSQQTNDHNTSRNRNFSQEKNNYGRFSTPSNQEAVNVDWNQRKQEMLKSNPESDSKYSFKKNQNSFNKTEIGRNSRGSNQGSARPQYNKNHEIQSVDEDWNLTKQKNRIS